MSAAAQATVKTRHARRPARFMPFRQDMMRAAFSVIAGTMLAGGAGDMFDAIEKGHEGILPRHNWWIIYTHAGAATLAPEAGWGCDAGA